MAKKQSRRSLSFSRRVHEFVKQQAAIRGISAAQLAEDALRAYLPGMPAATQAAIEHRRVTSRKTPEQIQAERVAADANAMLRGILPAHPPREVVNPCRRERCHVLHLHEAGSCA